MVRIQPGDRGELRITGPLVLGEELTGVPAELAHEAEALLAREAARAPALAFGGDGPSALLLHRGEFIAPALLLRGRLLLRGE